MEVNLDILRDAISKEVEESKSTSTEYSGSDYKIIYPAYDGKYTIRLLYNPKGGVVQRRIVRHNSGSGKVPCLQVYGEECPICSAITEAENAKGKECGAFKKYGYKTRGMCYAQVVNLPGDCLRDNKEVEPGDIVLFMYPKTVYDTINSIMLESGSHLSELVSENEGIPIVITRETKKGGFPDYRIEPYAYGKSKAFEDADGKSGNDIYDEKLNNLPNIMEDLVPKYPDEETRLKAKTLADTIKAEYIEGKVINPGDADVPYVDENDSPYVNSSEPISNVVKEDVNKLPGTITTDSSLPECFGKYCDEKKCWACLSETQCMEASGK